MHELMRIFNLGFKDVKSDKERRFRQRVKSLYIEICTEEAKKNRKAIRYNRYTLYGLENRRNFKRRIQKN